MEDSYKGTKHTLKYILALTKYFLTWFNFFTYRIKYKDSQVNRLKMLCIINLICLSLGLRPLVESGIQKIGYKFTYY